MKLYALKGFYMLGKNERGSKLNKFLEAIISLMKTVLTKLNVRGRMLTSWLSCRTDFKMVSRASMCLVEEHVQQLNDFEIVTNT